MTDLTTLPLACGIRARDCGLFVGRGTVPHVSRIIDCNELIFVRSGELRMFEESDQFTVAAGDTLLLRPGRRHGGLTVMSRGLEFYWVHFTTVTHADAPAQVPRHGTPTRPRIIESLWRRLLDDQSHAPLDPISGGLVIALILTEVRRATPPHEVSGGAGLASEARTWLTGHWHEAVSTWDVAKAIDCHPHHLARVYRETFQTSVLSDIQALRLDHARHLLITTRLDLVTIARNTGLGSPAWLRRTYRRRFGESPRDTRRAHSRMHTNSM